jgi:hypothetical protein
MKAIGEPRLISQAMFQLKKYTSLRKNTYPVFVAPYISEVGRKLCKEYDIGYIDLSGNVYLRFDTVYIERMSNENIKKEKRT